MTLTICDLKLYEQLVYNIIHLLLLLLHPLSMCFKWLGTVLVKERRISFIPGDFTVRNKHNLNWHLYFDPIAPLYCLHSIFKDKLHIIESISGLLNWFIDLSIVFAVTSCLKYPSLIVIQVR